MDKSKDKEKEIPSLSINGKLGTKPFEVIDNGDDQLGDYHDIDTNPHK